MPASKQTANFQLPQYAPLDTVSALVTFNGAMGKIDAALQEIKTTADAGSMDITQITTQLTEVQADLSAMKAIVQPLSTMLVKGGTLQPGCNGTVRFWTNGSLVVSDVAIGGVIANMTHTALANNTNVYNIATNPDDLFNLGNTHPIDQYARVGVSMVRESGASNTNILGLPIIAWRSANITYIGVAYVGGNFEEPNIAVYGNMSRGISL